MVATSSTERAQPISLIPKQLSTWKRARISLLGARWPILALFILGVVIFMALFASAISPADPNRQSLVERLMPPLTRDEATGQMRFLLGSDGLGRDLWTRIIYGAQISLAVGVLAVAVGGLFGTSLGIIAGYFGGRVDDFIMRLADIQLAFPFILLAIMVLVVLGPGVWNLVPVLGIGQWVTYARIARGQTIAQREKEYVEAARCIGASNLRIMVRAILPNVLAPLIVIASFNVASAILAEASLSFLGLGVPPTVPTWGGILNESRDQILAGKWWPAFFPGLAIMLTVLSLNILGDWLRDFLDPRLRGR
ncbi:MAG: ABC transporter permease [Anaerolineae bacterium]|nr:ABC transporter permease [Anaerolineae bacterium]